MIPNKLIYAQIISILLSISFFIFNSKNSTGIDFSILIKLAAYNITIIIFCNINAYLTNFYKRKQFADSKELLRISVTDTLTGIYNRVKFNEELDKWIDNCNRARNPISLVILDIDDFKKVNDTYGHLVGDSILQNIVSTIKKEIRHTDIFARWGGEEFVLLLPNTDIHQAMRIVERIRMCIQNNKYDKVKNVTCSFGLAELKRDEDAESLLQRTDKLLYDAKDCGKNIVVCETEKIRESISSDTPLYI